MLTFDYNEETRQLTCFFKGRMDTVMCMQLTQVLEDKFLSLPKGEHAGLNDIKIIFDLKEVGFISSSFIRICVGFSKRVPSGCFCIVNSDPFIKKTFKIAGLDNVLNVR